MIRLPCATLSPSLDRGYNKSYTDRMKTAISLPDPLFHAAEQFAQAHGLSRSELFARALHTYLQAYQAHAITETLNQLYAEEESALEPSVIRAQAQVVAKEDW